MKCARIKANISAQAHRPTKVWMRRAEYRPWPTANARRLKAACPRFAGTPPIAGHFTKPWPLVAIASRREEKKELAFFLLNMKSMRSLNKERGRTIFNGKFAIKTKRKIGRGRRA